MQSKWAGAIMTLLVAYFAYHAFAGEQGLGSWTDKQAELVDKQAQLTALKAQNAALQNDIDRLTPGQVDPDLVEYLARRELGFVYKDELILIDPKSRNANLHK